MARACERPPKKNERELFFSFAKVTHKKASRFFSHNFLLRLRGEEDFFFWILVFGLNVILWENFCALPTNNQNEFALQN